MSTLSSEWDEYLNELREDAHQLLSWGYSDIRSQLAIAKDEYEITGLLADGMEARIDSPATPERFMYYSVHNERPISPGDELGKQRPKLDIQIQRNNVRPKPHFTFEAKRLRDDGICSINDTMRKYLGGEGIGRFLIDYYSAESMEAAMLGCIQAHDAEFWFEKVSLAFDADTINGGVLYALTSPLEYAHVIADFPDERMSGHMRNSGSEIKLFHLFIDCR
jgi:hypothetical protein